MFETLRDGFLGLALIIGNMFSPSGSDAFINIESVRSSGGGYIAECEMELAWNQEMTRLLHAGIPVRFKISRSVSEFDTSSFIREMVYDVAGNKYGFSDYTGQKKDSLVYRSRDFPQLLMALREFSEWEIEIPEGAKECILKVRLLPSEVSRLDRVLDMSEIWGYKSIQTTIEFTDK